MRARAHTHNTHTHYKKMTKTEKDGTGLTKIFVSLNLDDGFYEVFVILFS